jgi:hypothetical protein
VVDYSFYISQSASILLAVAYPWLAAKKDAMQIIANNSLDSLKADWHRVNVWIRVTAFGCMGVAADVQHLTFPYLALAFGYFCFAAGIFWLLFDYRLNTLRGLEPGYVGANADADALIKWLAMRFNYTMEEAGKRIKWAAFVVTSFMYFGACFWVLS